MTSVLEQPPLLKGVMAATKRILIEGEDLTASPGLLVAASCLTGGARPPWRCRTRTSWMWRRLAAHGGWGAF